MISTSRKSHILIVTDAWYPQVNGVVRTLIHTKNELIAKGHKVTLLTPEGFFTIPCPSYPEIRLALFPATKVANIIRQESPDIIHIATEGTIGLAARNFCLRNNLNFTTAYHTRFPEYIYSRTKIPLGLTYAFIRWFHKPSQNVMAPTQQVILDLNAWRIHNTELWPRGVDLDLFKPPSRRTKNKRPILLYVGRVSIEKNIEAFLKIDIDADKWVVGDGPEMASLKKRFPDVIFHGMKTKEELPEFYGKADVFVFPSKTDTFGLVLLEALACGLPVAAYPVTGAIDVIGASNAGALNDDLKKAVHKALKLSSNVARAHAETFSWRTATDIFEACLIHCHTQDEYSVVTNPHKNNIGVKRAINAFNNSWSGLRFAINEESAFRQEVLLALILLPLAFWLPVSDMYKILMAASVLLVLIIELLNSSIEAAIDRISYEHHGLSKRAKDYGSAAVFLSIVLSALIYLSAIHSYLNNS